MEWGLSDDNSGGSTARPYQLSADGQHWYTAATVSHSQYITPDQVGIVCNPGASANAIESERAIQW